MMRNRAGYLTQATHRARAPCPGGAAPGGREERFSPCSPGVLIGFLLLHHDTVVFHLFSTWKRLIPVPAGILAISASNSLISMVLPPAVKVNFFSVILRGGAWGLFFALG